MKSLSVIALASLTCLQACNKDTCAYNGKTYSVGDHFKNQDGCNTCMCEAAGTISCTLVACLGDAGFEPPDASPAPDAALTDVAPSCTLPTTLTFGYEGGMVVYQDQNVLDPQGAMTITRTYYARAGVDGAAVRTCRPPLPACGAPAVLSVANIVADLGRTDVQAAFVPGQSVLYGIDQRPIDGPLWSITLGNDETVSVGAPCSQSSTTACVAIPVGLALLTDDLQRMAAAASATAGCQGL